jgi:arylformamidase
LSLDPDLEREYNPRVSVPDFQAYLDKNSELCRRARDRLAATYDLRYGPGPRQLLDIYLPLRQSKALAPLLVYVHGGFWRALGKDAGGAVALTAAENGIMTVSVGYDLCPQVSLPVIVSQVRDAIAFVPPIIEQFGGDASRLVLAGTSAGAHLIAMALSHPSAADLEPNLCGAVLVSGIYNLDPVLKISVNHVVRLDEISVEHCSPVRHKIQVDIPVLLAVGELETPSWISQSFEYLGQLQSDGHHANLIVLPDAHHFSTGLAIKGSVLNSNFVRSFREWTS